jgi:hypothetical protein
MEEVRKQRSQQVAHNLGIIMKKTAMHWRAE